MAETFQFPDVTLLITHYNRCKSLQRLLNRLKQLNCKFDDVVVSDDASRPENLEKLYDLQSEFGFRLITTPVNRGLANCLNKGQDAVKTSYTLYIQEDFEPSDLFPPRLADALEIMNKKNEIDYVRFWASFRFPSLKPFDKGFSETLYKPLRMNHFGFFMYSDNPHIRRSNFLEKFGRFEEGIAGEVAEHNMAIRFIQRKGKGLFYEDYGSLFKHINEGEEQSTFPRASWRTSANPILLSLRTVYLRYKCLKCMWQVKFMRPKKQHRRKPTTS
jgi:glycosyltransferase involved in cell wall biosynthesis